MRMNGKGTQDGYGIQETAKLGDGKKGSEVGQLGRSLGGSDLEVSHE